MNIENLPGEQWLPIPGYESFYAVSNMGRVRSFPRECWNGISNWVNPGRILKVGDNGYGYAFVSLNSGRKNTKNHYVHRLVADAFIPHSSDPKATEVNHMDGNKRNNNATNLEWVTRKENAVHGYATGLLRGRRGAEHWKSIPVEAVRWDGVVLGVFANMRCAATTLSVPRTKTIEPYGRVRFARPGTVYFRRAEPQKQKEGA